MAVPWIILDLAVMEDDKKVYRGGKAAFRLEDIRGYVDQGEGNGIVLLLKNRNSLVVTNTFKDIQECINSAGDGPAGYVPTNPDIKEASCEKENSNISVSRTRMN